MKNKLKTTFQRPSTWFGAAILLAWGVTLAVLLKNYGTPGDIPTDPDSSDFLRSVTVAEKWQDIEEWMEIVQVNPDTGQTQSVGATRTTIAQRDNPTSTSAYTAEFVFSAKLTPLLPVATISGVAELDKDSALTSFGVRGELARLALSTQGTVVREKLYVLLDKPNETSRYIKTLDQPVTFGEVLRPSLSRHMKLAPGEKMSSPIIDPLTGQSRGYIRLEVVQRERIQLQGRSVTALRIRSSIGDIETLMWVDEQGRTLRRNLVNNLRMDRVSRDRALELAPGIEKPVKFPPLDLAQFQNLSVDPASSPNDLSGPAGMLNLILR